MLTLSPTKVALCPMDRLVLTCTSNVVFLHWEILDPQQIALSVTRTVANDGITPPVMFGATTFHFSLNSAPRTLPHISQIHADNVANGTEISCSEWINQEALNTQAEIICIVGSSCGTFHTLIAC